MDRLVTLSGLASRSLGNLESAVPARKSNEIRSVADCQALWFKHARAVAQTGLHTRKIIRNILQLPVPMFQKRDWT